MRESCVPDSGRFASFVKSVWLLNDPSLRLFDEPYEHLHVFSTVRLRLQFLQSLRGVELRGQQHFVGVMNFANAFLAETAPLKPDRIQAVGLNIAGSGRLGKRKNVAGNSRPATDERVCANANKVVYRTKRAYRSPLFDRDVATEGGGIGQNDVVTNQAIVGDVRVSHHQDVVAHAG